MAHGEPSTLHAPRWEDHGPMASTEPQLSWDELLERTGRTAEQLWRQCHVASLALVNLRIWPGARVARGVAYGVHGHQHSWVVVGDPYDGDAPAADATWWSFQHEGEPPHIRYGTQRSLGLTPHGSGFIFDAPYPTSGGGPVIPPPASLDGDALRVVRQFGPLDAQGWAMLASLPPAGLPHSRDILTAMWQDDRLRVYCKIDVVGMATDLNPSGLYLPTN